MSDRDDHDHDGGPPGGDDHDGTGGWVPFFEAPMADAKEVRAACEEAGVSVAFERASCSHGRGAGGCGCPPKMRLLADPADVPQIARLLDERWRELARREGTVDDDHPSVAAPAGEGAGEEPPCPACGTAAPLEAGACTGCGLQLE